MLLLCEWVELDLQLFNRKLMHAPSPKPLLLSDILHRKQEVEEYPHVTCASNKNPLLLLILCVCLCVCVCVLAHVNRFIGEESVAAGDRVELTKAPTWIIDPIDGTVNFVHRSSPLPHLLRPPFLLPTSSSPPLLLRRGWCKRG